MAEKAKKQAENEAIDAGEDNGLQEGTTASKSSILKRFSPFFIISAIVVVECIGAFFLAPSGTPVFAEGDLTPEQILVLQKAGLVESKSSKEDVPCVEVDMGEYSITHSSKAEGATIQANFHLFGVVELGKEAEFRGLFDGKENRVRDLVRSIIRESEISELAEPGLGLIKRRILEKVNRELGKTLLEEVVFSDYSFFDR